MGFQIILNSLNDVASHAAELSEQIIPPNANLADENSPIKENSLIYKILSVLPALGIIPQLIAEKLLMCSAKTTSDLAIPRFIKIIEVKNHYKICGIIRSMLTIAGIIVCLALGIFSPWTLIPVAVLAAWTVLDIVNLNHNRQILADLHENGPVFPFADSGSYVL